MAEKKEDSNKIKVVYIGQDAGYFQTLKDKFVLTYKDLEFDFISTPVDDNFHPQTKFIETVKNKPDILFIDFSKQRQKVLPYAKLIRNENTTKTVSTTGLHDYLNTEEEINTAIMAGIRINHIKSAEIEDVIFDAMSFYDDSLSTSKDFAVARFQDEFEIIADLKVSYATSTHFKVETNIPFAQDQILELTRHPLEVYLKSPKFHVKNVKEYDLKFNGRFGIDLSYHYLPGYLEDEKSIEDKAIVKQLESIKSDINDWVEGKYKQNVDYTSKVLVVDKEMDIFKTIDRNIDEYPFFMKIQSEFSRGLLSLKRQRPEVIGVVYSEPPPEDENIDESSIGVGQKIQRNVENIDPDIFKYNDLSALSVLTKTIQKIENYTPIIIIFKTTYDSGHFQKELSYQKIMAYNEPPNMDIVAKLTQAIDKHKENSLVEKLEQKLEKLKKEDPTKWNGKSVDDLKEKRVIFSCNDPKTLVQSQFFAKTQTLTEQIIYFTSEQEIPVFTVLKTKFPIPMLITTFPISEKDEFAKLPNCYKGLINCVGEQAKKELRMYINRILGTEKDEKEKAELEEFKKKNEQAAAAKKQQEVQAQEAEDQADDDTQQIDKAANE